MKYKILTIIAAAAMVLAMSSCRDTSDEVVSYGQNDNINFAAADTCYEGQFKAIWTAMNCNYGIWDYEAGHGLDWDAVYSKYLPKMQELDKRMKGNNPISDDEFRQLYEEILAPLHDGHFTIQVKNLGTGNRIMVSPSVLRNISREDYNISMVPPLNYYSTPNAGENLMTEWYSVSFRPNDFIGYEIKNAISFIDQQIATLQAKQNRTDSENYYLNRYHIARQEMSSFKLNGYNDIQYYNNVLTTKYSDVGINLNAFTIPEESCMDIRYADFNGIVYLGFSSFHLSDYLTDKLIGTPCGAMCATELRKIWMRWTNLIQQKHNSGTLKGVIIDVRNNGGGRVYDYQYVLGALLPKGKQQIAMSRFKTGIGRYDYSPLTPEKMPTLTMDHETVTEPIVVLGNCRSVSMAEVTCLGAKELDNARFIGTRTWGGMCLINDDPKNYSVSYAGSVGVKNETSFYALIPTNVTITNMGDILEGVGVTPDIEEKLDLNLLQTTGRDSQLERALQYIRTGN